MESATHFPSEILETHFGGHSGGTAEPSDWGLGQQSQVWKSESVPAGFWLSQVVGPPDTLTSSFANEKSNEFYYKMFLK